MKRIAWMLCLLISGCHAAEKHKVKVTTTLNPIDFEVPDQTPTSVSVTYECEW